MYNIVLVTLTVKKMYTAMFYSADLLAYLKCFFVRPARYLSKNYVDFLTACNILHGIYYSLITKLFDVCTSQYTVSA